MPRTLATERNAARILQRLGRPKRVDVSKPGQLERDEGARASKTAINGETWRFSKQDFMP
jgi:hypothetical protein